ncbi:hypothetical protein LTR72_010906 [Exophiala xenobiotica]|nr:hypothetical protein LTR72_010906 [Exophiala xenobiotica]
MESARHEHAKKHFQSYLVLVILFMGIASITYGYASAIIGTTLGQPSFNDYMRLETRTNATALTGAIVAMWYAGSVFGCFAQGWISNRYGRKAAIISGCIIVVISGALLTGSVSPGMFIAFRFINGWGANQLNYAVPLWISEITPPHYRATLTVIHTLGINLGNNIAGFVGIGFYYTSGKQQWRGPMAIQIFPALVVLSGIFWLPESPRYLLTKNKKDEAWAIVRRLHSDPGNEGDAFAKREFFQMSTQIELDMTAKNTYWEIFKRPSYRKRAFMIMFFTFSLMSCGALVINNFGTTLYRSLGFVLCCLITEATIQEKFLGTDHKSGLSAGVAILFLYNFFYGIFLESAPFFFIGEIWPTHLRGQGYSLGIGMLDVTIIIWTQPASTAFAKIGWKFYMVFMVFAAIAYVVSELWFPNTLGIPLEEIAALFGDTGDVVVYERDLTNEVVLESSEKGHSVLQQENVGSEPHNTKTVS